MLTLHKASAGSGKTYALAKTFITVLISVPVSPGSQKRRLRTVPEIADAPSRAMAITFTNKATAEMMQRILSAIAAIAYAAPGDTPDYLADFVKDFNASRAEVQDACLEALWQLLTHFSDFHVSTIDSFFQSVLRTFAYEAQLPDSFGIEIDEDYLAVSALESIKDSLETNTYVREARFWLDELMRDKGNSNSWNLFIPKNSPTHIFKQITNALKNLNKEEFKVIREALEEYFAKNDAIKAYKCINAEFDALIKARHRRLLDEAQRIKALVIDSGYENEQPAALDAAIAKLRDKPEEISQRTTPISFVNKTSKNSKLKKALAQFKQSISTDEQQFLEDYNALAYLLNHPAWMPLKQLFPSLGLIMTARAYISDLLEEQNAVAISESNSILKRIISDDDTPFVYERIGARLNHLLIDEFQDTSQMQWQNLRPLLANNLSREEDNLLIGDAKQSIYRFRNADPSIISHTVPEQFPQLRLLGGNPSENTNWRSDLRIVQFNNLVFDRLGQSYGPEIAQLYDSVIQTPHHTDKSGYVEMRWLESKKEVKDSLQTAGEEDDENTDIHSKAWFDQLGPLVTELTSRGYRQRDIAFLVKTHQQGKAVIDALEKYNSTLPPSVRKIQYVSEDSLSIGASRAVNAVVNCLQTIYREEQSSPVGVKSDTEAAKDATPLQAAKHDWHRIRTDLAFFIQTHPELPPEDQLMKFFETGQTRDTLGDLVTKMQSVAIPALIEVFIYQFVSLELRRTDAPYLAAFQDAAIDFCDSHPADIGCFLEWWEAKGKYKNITSPAGTEAVQIMTIHKSKGLEFGCVILPCLDTSCEPSRSNHEWAWVKPEIPELSAGLIATLPPFMPVDLSDGRIRGTSLNPAAFPCELPYLPYYEAFRQNVCRDNLNTVYVAFTRAVHELYIFADAAKGRTFTAEIKTKLTEIVSEHAEGQTLEALSGTDIPPEALPDPAEISFEETDGEKECIMRFGQKLSEAEVRADVAQAERKESAGGVRHSTISDYFVNPNLSNLQYRPEEMSVTVSESKTSEEEEDLDDPDELDPRSEGNLMHKAMQWIETEDDLESALLRLKTRGDINFTQMDSYRKRIREVLGFIRPRGWFEPHWRVVNERSLFRRRQKTLRPDRVMVSADGSRMVIVDYKFGRKAMRPEPDGSWSAKPRHISQLREYRDTLMQTGAASEAEAYIWYVPFGQVVKVD